MALLDEEIEMETNDLNSLIDSYLKIREAKRAMMSAEIANDDNWARVQDGIMDSLYNGYIHETVIMVRGAEAYRIDFPLDGGKPSVSEVEYTVIPSGGV